ncbi:ribokinase [Pinirhizobacter soli]|uniref:ribokinase n=1 Tax=Pinirhizobacter soli TaxID=2786953 RepID=UPI00202A4585|nr:ribokinase [Pinirhizobacter soli]
MSVAGCHTVLVAGSANLDFVVTAARVPVPGETILGRDFRTFPGGKGANQAVAAARAGGAATRMLLALGNDAHAEPIEASLRAAGVKLDIVRAASEATGVAFICVADSAENAITVAPGANATLRAAHLPPLGQVSHLLLQLETPLPVVQAWAMAAREAGVVVALNAAPAATLPEELLRCIDMLIVNEGELAMLAGPDGDIDARMQSLGVECVVVTLGSRGCRAWRGGESLSQSGFAVDAVDTTGAGDTFCGTLVAALSRGEAFASALRRATAASALACTKMGAQAGMPSFDEVERLLAASIQPGHRAIASRQPSP